MQGLLEIIVPIITAIITGIIGPIVAYYYRKKSREKRSSNPNSFNKTEYLLERRREEIDQNVQNQLDEIREEIDADRAWIIEFHQGKKEDQSVNTLKKFSMIYESVAPGISREQDNFSELACFLFY